MKTKRNIYRKKALSLLLTLVMVCSYVGLFAGLIGTDPFGTALEADALASQTGGTYTYNAYVKVTNDMSNCNMTVSLYGRELNGRSNNEVYMGGFTWSDKDTSETTYSISSGNSAAGVFPTRINVYLGGVKYHFDRDILMEIHLQIRDANGNLVDHYLEGVRHSFQAEAVNVTSGNPATFYWCTDQETWSGKNNAFNCDFNIQSDEYPHLNSATLSGDTAVTTNGETEKTYSVDSAKDQYNVNWAFTSVTWESNNTTCADINNSGKVNFRDNNGKDYNVTFTPTLHQTNQHDVVLNGQINNIGPVNVAVTTPKTELTLNSSQSVSVGKAGFTHAYFFTPPEDGNYVFYTTGSMDPKLTVYRQNASNSNNLGTQIGTNDNITENTETATNSGNLITQFDGIRVANLLGINSNQAYCVVKLKTSNAPYIVVSELTSGTGSFTLMARKAVNITFDGTGGIAGTYNSYTIPMPAGQTMKMNQSGFTRSNHSLLAWSKSNTQDESKECMASNTSYAIPSEATSYYALWNPTAAPVLSSSAGDYSADVDWAGEIEYYQFTPTETRKYLIYGTGSVDSYLLWYNKNTYANNATYLEKQNDATDSNGNTTGYNFGLPSNNQFFLLKELTKNTTYLYGVKYKGTQVGSVSFHFEPVYKVTYNANGGSGAPTAQDKFINKTLTLSSTKPTRSGYVFKGWGTSDSDKTVDYAAGASYTGNADITLYAIWSREITNDYHFYVPNVEGNLLDDFVQRSGTAYNAEANISITSPAAQTDQNPNGVPTEFARNDKTWTLVGWNERTTTNANGVVWGGAGQLPDDVGLNTSHSVLVASASHIFMPVYKLKSTKFYANFNYYRSGADTYSKVTMDATVNGNATTGDMPVAQTAENGTQTTVQQSYAKNGKYWSLIGWNKTASTSSSSAAPTQGTPQISISDSTVSLDVPGATSSDKTNTANLTPVELYPVYELTGTSINARFHYFDKQGNDDYYEASGVAATGAATSPLKFPSSDALIKDPGTAQEVNNNTYTENGVTYTLVGWNYTPNASANPNDKYSVQTSLTYVAFEGTVNVAPHDDPANDWYDFYPVYTCTTTSRYHYYTSDGGQSSAICFTTVEKCNSNIPTNVDVAILTTAEDFSDTVTLEDGRTFDFVGWRTDTNSEVYTVAPDTLSQNHAIRDDEYHYYAIYQNDELTLSYCTSHKTLTASCTPADQVLSQYNGMQYINAGLAADTDNASAHSFPVNPDAATATPERVDGGYTFIGWDTTDNETETCEYVNNGTISIRHNQTLYAKYTVDARYVTFIYFDKDVNGLTGETVSSNPLVEVRYDDLTRDDANNDATNGRFIANAPTVKKGPVKEETIAHVNNTYHYVFSYWQRSDGRAIYKDSLTGTDYNANLKNVTDVEGITVRAIYDAYRHHYVTLTAAELAQQDTTDTAPYKAATCTEDGYQWQRCTVCGYVYKQILEKYDHKNSEGTEVVTYSGYKPATCTETGTYAVANCAICNQPVLVDGAKQYYDYNSEMAAFVRVPADNSNNGIIPALGHRYQVASTVPPTCTEDGYVLKVCANDSSHTLKEYDPENESLQKLGHTIVTTEGRDATCTEDGYSERKECSRCGFVVEDSYVIRAMGHKLVKHAAIAPTCTEDGVIEYYTCSVEGCGAMFKDKYGTQPVNEAGLVDPALGHSWKQTDEAEEPTCTLPGHTAGEICRRCGLTRGCEITAPALEHQWGEYVHYDIEGAFKCKEVAGYRERECQRCHETERIDDAIVAHTEATEPEKAAKCNEVGHNEYTYCSVCGDILSEYIEYAKLPHTPVVEDDDEAKEPTCTEPGHTAKTTCSVCHEVIEQAHDIPKLGHNFSAWIDTTASTCTTAGEQKRFCKRCGAEETQTVPAGDHVGKNVPAVPATCYAEGKTAGIICKYCGEVLDGCETVAKTAHVMGAPVTIPATCTVGGKTITKCVNFEFCGEQTVVESDSLGHNLATVTDAIPATCDSDGWTAEKKCTRDGCGYVEKAQYEPRLEHDWVTISASATCTASGLSEYKKCRNCGKYLVEPQEISALGHDWTAWTITPATCLQPGSKTRSCKRDGCGFVETETIPVGGHKLTMHAEKAPSCGVKGLEAYYTCSVCRKTFSDAAGTNECDLNDLIIPALEHNWVDDETFAPTCTKKGYTVQKCSYCNATQRAKEVDRIPHVEGVAATCHSMTICAVCGQPYGTYDGNNHDFRLTEHQDSTCIVHGYNKYKCANCPRTKTEQLPLADHRTLTVNDPAPSCTEAGHYQNICQDCGKVINEGTLPAKGHLDNDGDGICERCGQEIESSSPAEEENGTTTGTCEKCGRNHVGETGGLFGYNGFICRLIAFFRAIVKIFKK